MDELNRLTKEPRLSVSRSTKIETDVQDPSRDGNARFAALEETTSRHIASAVERFARAGRVINSTNYIPRGPRKNGGPRKCSGLERVALARSASYKSRGTPRAVSPYVRSTSPFSSFDRLACRRSARRKLANSWHSRAAQEELWNRTLATRTVTPVEPPAWHSPVEYRRKPAPQKAIATSLARPPRTSSNFTICRARRGRAHHRRAWKRATSLPT